MLKILPPLPNYTLHTKAHTYDYIPSLHRLILRMSPPKAVHDEAARLLTNIILEASRVALMAQAETPPSLANARLRLGSGTNEVSVEQDGIRTTLYKLPDSEILFDQPGKVISAF
ncbi:hypothetical protein PG997_000117 [Apiospora hydei]|uniref:Uncharacterized protein n=1 Tax=Apiospora hydei TaxID=1337664 RepID=A0ABR1X9U9_9PEZI